MKEIRTVRGVKYRASDDKIADRYVAVVDILGFRELLREKSLTEIVGMIAPLFGRAANLQQSWSVFYPDSRSASGVLRPQRLHYSDTITFWSPPITGKRRCKSLIIKSFFSLVSDFIFESFLFDLPLRAGIGFGETYIDAPKRIVLGKAFVDAHLTESCQDWVGGAFHPDCPVGTYSLKHWNTVVEHPVPTKADAPLHLQYALNWIARATGPVQYGVSAREPFERAFKRYFAKGLPATARTKYENAKWFYEMRMARRLRIAWQKGRTCILP